jgi:xylulokinase
VNFLGIDIGSSGCKALAVDEDGRQRALAHRDYEVSFSPGGGATLDSDEVITKCFEAISECAGRVEPGSIRGIGISSQGEAFTAVGERGETLSAAMISSDTTSEEEMRAWVGEFGEDRLYEITGHTPHPMFTLFKLLHFKQALPDVWNRTRHFLCFEDLLQFRLGLRPSISWPLAGRTLMFDVRRHAWDEDILRRVPVRPDQLATPIPSGAPAGCVAAGIASRLGLSGDVVVVAGGHDQTCSALGAGVVEQGVAMLATGTVECICAAMDRPVFSTPLRENNLCTYNYSVPDLYGTVAYSLTGGNIFKWFKDHLGSPEADEARISGRDPYEALLETIDASPSSLLVLPYFTPSGTPYFDTRTRGAILGLRLSTRKNEILKALLEGVSLEMRLNLEILDEADWPTRELRWVGGGSKSLLMAQIKANVMNRPVTMLNVNEAGCFGAAMLACSAVTGRPVRTLASSWVTPKSTVEPRPEYADVYRKRFDAYRELYHHIRDISF